MVIALLGKTAYVESFIGRDSCSRFLAIELFKSVRL